MPDRAFLDRCDKPSNTTHPGDCRHALSGRYRSLADYGRRRWWSFPSPTRQTTVLIQWRWPLLLQKEVHRVWWGLIVSCVRFFKLPISAVKGRGNFAQNSLTV